MKSLSHPTQGNEFNDRSASAPGQTGFETSCARLCIEFANALDAGEYQRVVDVFTADAEVGS